MSESGIQAVMAVLKATKMEATPTRLKNILSSTLTTDTIARRLRKECAKDNPRIVRHYIQSTKKGTKIAVFKWNDNI